MREFILHFLAKITGFDFLILRPRRLERETKLWKRKFIEANKTSKRWEKKAGQARTQLERLRSIHRQDQVFFFRHIWRMFDFAEWAESLLADEQVDVCIAHDTYALEAARRLQLRTGCEIIHDAVEFPVYSGRSGQMRHVYQCHEPEQRMLLAHHLDVIRSASQVLVTTPGLIDWYVEHTDKTPIVVRNCLDYESPQPTSALRDDCGLGADERVLVYINSAFAGGGVETILGALPYLPDDVHLAVAGQVRPHVEQEIISFAEKLSMGQRLHFVGERSPEQMTSYRSGGDLAVIPLDPSIPNHQTCLPNRVFEAIMSRLPVICSNLPVVRSLVEDYGCGMAFESDHPESVAAVISNALMNLTELKERCNIAAAELNWEKERLKFENAMEALLGGETGRVVLLANRSISVNQRVFRHSRTLADMGHAVTVLSHESPCPALRDERIACRESGPL